MSNDLVTQARNAGLSDIAEGAMIISDNNNAFTQHANAAGVSDGVYGRFNGNNGDFIVQGADGLSIEPENVLAFNIFHAKQLWLGFTEDNKPVRGPEVMMATGKRLPDWKDDPELAAREDVRWTQMIVLPVRHLDGSPQIMLSCKADNQYRGIWKLIKAYGASVAKHKDEKGQNKIPLVQVGHRPFPVTVEENGRKVKVTKFADEYKIVDWMSSADLEASISEGVAADETEVAADAPVAVSAPVAAAAPAAAAPTKRFGAGVPAGIRRD